MTYFKPNTLRLFFWFQCTGYYHLYNVEQKWILGKLFLFLILKGYFQYFSFENYFYYRILVNTLYPVKEVPCYSLFAKRLQHEQILKSMEISYSSIGVLMVLLCKTDNVITYINFFKIILFYFILATPRGMQDLSSPTRDQTHAPCSGSAEA